MAIPRSPTGEMPFLDHLEELRWRIIYALGAVLVGVAIGFVCVWKFPLLEMLERPILQYLPPAQRLVYTHPADVFTILVQTAFIVGLALALPVIVYQVWAFLSPALHVHERRVVVGVLGSSTVLFIGGASLAFFLVLPWTLNFFFRGLPTAKDLTPMITIGDYMSMVTNMCLVFGLTFEVPVVIVALSAFGIVTPEQLGKARRIAIVVILGLSAIVTPGDFIGTTLALAVPLYLLYEASVVVSWLIARRKKRREAALDTPNEAVA